MILDRPSFQRSGHYGLKPHYSYDVTSMAWDDKRNRVYMANSNRVNSHAQQTTVTVYELPPLDPEDATTTVLEPKRTVSYNGLPHGLSLSPDCKYLYGVIDRRSVDRPVGAPSVVALRIETETMEPKGEIPLNMTYHSEAKNAPPAKIYWSPDHATAYSISGEGTIVEIDPAQWTIRRTMTIPGASDLAASNDNMLIVCRIGKKWPVLVDWSDTNSPSQHIIRNHSLSGARFDSSGQRLTVPSNMARSSELGLRNGERPPWRLAEVLCRQIPPNGLPSSHLVRWFSPDRQVIICGIHHHTPSPHDTVTYDVYALPGPKPQPKLDPTKAPKR